MTAEIYGLFDPDTGALRYVGKAKSASARFKRHLNESTHETRPVHVWIAGLVKLGKLPRLGVLETVPLSEWVDAEIRLIALHRQTSNLLNVADGGDRPSQTTEQRRKCAKTLNKRNAEKSPQMLNLIMAKQQYARLATKIKKEGDIFEYWCMRMKMHNRAIANPKLFGTWLVNGR